ncbi:MAG: cytochrome c3 family protein [Candidatus Methanoperedens sp.]|nr:cytochrome c3 family protein [Candidatus Methanoperedens sp.]MCZ7370516.1 cytochrome c3 family protein [Candidatus Methanoperedens sp.]
MATKLMLIGLAIAAVGLVALPQTLALFVGQHNFYDTISNNVYGGGTTTNIPCGKCHADIFAELKQPGGVNAAHRAYGCEGCHMTTAMQKEGIVNGPPDLTGGQFHAAASPACLDCHNASFEPGLNATNILNGPEEVHKPFANAASNSSLLKGANEACIACHTHVAVDINWTKAYKIAFDAQENMSSDGSRTWTVGNFTIEGSAFIQTYGNQSGGVNNSTQPVISISPTPIGWDPLNP